MGKKAVTRYDTPDANGWRKVCDDLFLAQFRGLPCEVCGATSKMYNGRQTRSCFHHLLEKDLHRAHRYAPLFGVILCPDHHSQYSREMSPHSKDTFAVMRFYKWLFDSHDAEFFCRLWDAGDEAWDKSWTYKSAYVIMGGSIKSLTGFAKDDKPLNHKAAVDKAEAGR